MGSKSLYGALACALLGLLVTAFLLFDPLPGVALRPPPAERLDVERTEVTAEGFRLKIRVDSPQPLLIAQVMVDGAYWVFETDPPGPLTRTTSAWVTVDYPWVADEVHHVRFITSLGSTFDHTIDVALPTPAPSWSLLVHYARLGILVGVIPIAFGMLFFPVLKSSGAVGVEFVLALTVGLLGYLFVDMTLAGMDAAGRASTLFGGATLVFIPMALALVALLAVGGRSSTAHDGRRIAVLIAVGIGLHNFGEGLAIGASFAAHEIALGTFLIVGFTLHNTTEGIGIVSPLFAERVALPVFVGLALLAGLPTVPGIWLGAFAYAPQWAAVFFGVGAGAVLQVMLEIDRFARVTAAGRATGSRFTATSVAGYCSGVAIMYVTALVVNI